MKTVVVSLLTLTLAFGSLCLAADKTVKTDTQTTPSQEMMKVSQDGFTAMRAIRAARVAIFNGEPKVAENMLTQAKNNLQAAWRNASFLDAKFAPKGKTTTTETQGTTTDWLPIDGQVALAETYVPSPEKAEHINKANKYFKDGQSKAAIEELRLGEIDVNYTCVLMPWDATMKCVTEATKLADEHKYYEANLVLKAAEDGLIIDSVSLVGDLEEGTDQHQTTQQHNTQQHNQQQQSHSNW